MLELTYLGNACFGVQSGSTSLLIDPHISENPECPYTLDEVVNDVADFDAVCVTHLAYDHVGDCFTLAAEYDLPVITEPATEEFLVSKGIEADRIKKLVWGMEAQIHDTSIRALKVDHVSTGKVDGRYLAGLPLSFLITEDETNVYHMGDTALFGDLELVGELHAPEATMIGVGQAHIEEAGPTGIQRFTREMTSEEAARAAEAVGSDLVIPMHFEGNEREQFKTALTRRGIDTSVADLEPGDSITVE
jgi:L-ascorbate metabolism protein UlaG (beta-lactamase superfamily)